MIEWINGSMDQIDQFNHTVRSRIRTNVGLELFTCRCFRSSCTCLIFVTVSRIKVMEDTVDPQGHRAAAEALQQSLPEYLLYTAFFRVAQNVCLNMIHYNAILVTTLSCS
jgi:hypothetical protein